MTGCGGAVTSGVAVGKVGRGLSARTGSVPQGAQVCALQEAIAGSEKPPSEACSKAIKNDQLWRRVMQVLAAHGETLEALANGAKGDTAGRLEAAQTGITGNDWISVDGASEQASRDAAAKLVNQMSNGSGGDLERALKDAAPEVKTMCDGLGAYLETQAKAFGDIQKEAEKKRASRSDRRCAAQDGRTVCVGESVIDRMLYANVFGQATLLESAHLEARENLAGFCAAHKKAEEAAADGRLGKDQTYTDIVEAVKSARKSQKEPGDAKAKPKK